MAEIIEQTVVNENCGEDVKVEKEEKDIYLAEGYAAMPTECMDQNKNEEEEENEYESGYMALPEDDPADDVHTVDYPENYEEIANIQLRIMEDQYKAVLEGSSLPSDTPENELKNRHKGVLSKPIDVVGDDDTSTEPAQIVKKKKSKKLDKKKAKPEKKAWTREEILKSFLPPAMATKEKKTISEKKKRLPEVKIAAVSNETSENSTVDGKTEQSRFSIDSEKIELIQSTMQSIHIEHTPKWAKNLSEEEVNSLVKKAAMDIIHQ